LGTESDVKSITAQELRNFRKHFYNSYMTTVVAGRVNHQEVLATLDKAYQQITPQPRTDLDAGHRLALAPGEIRHTTLSDPQLTYSVVDMSFPAPAKADLRDRVAMEFIGNLLDGGPSSLLEKRLIHDKRLATAIGVEYGPMKHTGIFGITVETTPGLEREALKETVQTISELNRMPLSQEKTNELRQQLMHKFRHELHSVEFTTHMIGQEMMTKSLPYFTDYMNLVASITPEDIMRVAQKYLSPTRYAVVYGIPAPTPFAKPGQTAQPAQAGGRKA
jgi:zinc protease